VTLIVGGFGDDLRAGLCRVRPGVDQRDKRTVPLEWTVAGVTRDRAYLVSTVDGAPAYGGSPSDESVLQAIEELKARGFSGGLIAVPVHGRTGQYNEAGSEWRRKLARLSLAGTDQAGLGRWRFHRNSRDRSILRCRGGAGLFRGRIGRRLFRTGRMELAALCSASRRTRARGGRR
jgi:hypothetical protein